ncbi:MAG: hypothetical protein ACI4DW_10145 [Lachnospiraceae bacterium]
MKQTKQAKTLKRLVGMLLVLVMAFQMPLGMVKAEGEDIGAGDYERDENGEMVCCLDAGDYRTIEVPTGYHLVIEKAVTATAVILHEGSFLEILNHMDENNPENNTYGSLICTTLDASQDAILFLQNRTNVPEVAGNPLELLSWSDEVSSFVDVANTDFEWKNFIYGENEQGEGAWYEQSNEDPADFFISFEGMEEGMEIRVAYSYDDGSNWNYAIEGTSAQSYHQVTSGELRYEEDFGNVYDCPFTLENIPQQEGAIRVTVKIEVDPESTQKVLNGPYDMDPCDNYQLWMTDTSFQYQYTDYTDFGCGSHNMHFAMAYNNSGKGAIVDEVNDYLYAYSNIDWNGNGSTDADDIKYALASELYVRFINPPLYESFGIPLPPNGEPGVFNNGVDALADLITFAGNTVSETAYDGDNNVVELTRYTATINWGVDEIDGSDVTSIIPVYAIPSSFGDSILVCTNFNKSDGTCATASLYIREIGDINDSDPNNNGDMKEFSASDIMGDQSEIKDVGLLVLANYSNVAAGGNGLLTMPMNTDGMYSFNASHMTWAESKGFSGQVNVRVMKPGNDYVVIHGSGEPNKVDGMGLNASATDTIWETGNNCMARVYVGYSTLTLMPVQTGIVSNNANDTKITGVELLDSSMRDGVEIIPPDSTGNSGTVNSSTENYLVKFESNFYDSVPLKITYANGDSRNLTIERIGLVINYFYLEDRGPGVFDGEIEYDCKPGSRLTFNYDYEAGEQIIVYATYYHPTIDPTTGNSGNVILHLKYDDGSEVYMESNAGNEWTNYGGSGYLGASGGGVATTTFFIDFVEAGNGSSNTTTSIPGFYATVLNADYNDPTSYGGTQIGSGLGVYWDGEITFVTR